MVKFSLERLKMAKYQTKRPPVVPAPVSPNARIEGKHWVITQNGLLYKDDLRRIEFEVSLDDDIKAVQKKYRAFIGQRAFAMLNS